MVTYYRLGTGLAKEKICMANRSDITENGREGSFKNWFLHQNY